LTEFGSLTPEDTLALFVIEPVDGGVTLTVTVAPAPFVIVPRLQVTVPDAWVQLPCDAEAELNVTPLGRLSETLTAVALEGPALLTPIV